MRRRDFITLFGGAVAVSPSYWPLAAQAQQIVRMRRIGVLMNIAADSPQSGIAAFAQRLQELGWIVGRNVQIDYRWGAGNVDRFRQYAGELAALAPDVIVT